jgi:hypothetical protein
MPQPRSEALNDRTDRASEKGYEIEIPHQLAREKARRITDTAVLQRSLREPITPRKGVKNCTPLPTVTTGADREF